jgi:hypothetical protein
VSRIYMMVVVVVVVMVRTPLESSTLFSKSDDD